MITIFAALFILKSPIILVPGSFRSRLTVTSSPGYNFQSCPRNLRDHPFWLKFSSFLPWRLKCTVNWLTLDYDEENGLITDQRNLTISTVDFGGLRGIRGTGFDVFGKSVATYFEKIINILEGFGYEKGVNLFGAPYDWRLGIDQPDEFWRNMTNIVEEAYRMNSNTKVKFLTHSFGAIIIHKFLSDKSKEEWRRKYIDSAVFSAPSFSGAGQSFITLYQQRFPGVPFYRNDQLTEMLSSLGSLHVHLPNFAVYKNATIFITPDDKEILAPDAVKFLAEHGRLNEKHLKMGTRNFQYASEFPKTLDVPVRMLYNSGIKTAFGLKVKDWNSDGQVIYRDGDGVVMSEGVDMVCDVWKKAGADVTCINLNSTKISDRHPFLILLSKHVDVLMNWLIGNNLNESFVNKEL